MVKDLVMVRDGVCFRMSLASIMCMHSSPICVYASNIFLFFLVCTSSTIYNNNNNNNNNNSHPELIMGDRVERLLEVLSGSHTFACTDHACKTMRSIDTACCTRALLR